MAWMLSLPRIDLTQKDKQQSFDNRTTACRSQRKKAYHMSIDFAVNHWIENSAFSTFSSLAVLLVEARGLVQCQKRLADRLDLTAPPSKRVLGIRLSRYTSAPRSHAGLGSFSLENRQKEATTSFCTHAPKRIHGADLACSGTRLVQILQ